MISSSRFMTSMRREKLRSFFESSPTARLLRSDLAPIVIDFLHESFKSRDAISIGQSELRTRLACYQEELHETDPDMLSGPPERYLTQWSDGGWLKRFVEAASTEPQFQLTPFAEEAIRFVDSALARGQSVVGTESRLRLVIETLEDIVRGASTDPDRRLEYLKEQRAAIDRDIAAIESGKSVQVYRPAQIRERFQTAVDLLTGLQSDFRAVEERFQSIAREVQQLQSSGHDTRGGILGFALDSEDLLKQQDEGISFFAFVNFLFSPVQQMALRKNIEEVQQLAPLADQQESLHRVRRMVPALLAEADKVMRTTSRLSATLRRLLDARAAAHRMRLSQVLRDIRQAAMHLRSDPPLDMGLSIDTEAELNAPLSRPFWTPPETFDLCTLIESPTDTDQANRIATAFKQLQRLDFRKLRSIVRESTLEGAQVSLPTLFESYRSESGVIELLGYLQIAHDDQHLIDPTQSDLIELNENAHRSHMMRVRVPRVIFLPKSTNRDIGRKPR